MMASMIYRYGELEVEIIEAVAASKCRLPLYERGDMLTAAEAVILGFRYGLVII